MTARSQLRMALAVAALLAVNLSFLHTAKACGGLFCSAANPVNQSAERIVFATDGQRTTAIIEIVYEGPSESFSWVLPVAGEPDVAVSSTAALARLQAQTNPVYRLQTNIVGECDSGSGAVFNAGRTGGDAAAEGATDPTVTVLASGNVGPYDYELISIDPGDSDVVDVAIAWLGDNGYDVTALGEGRLRPYLEAGLNLLAFRLTKNASAGSIRPVMLTYDGSRPMIPIRPTAVAANDDMGVLVWVLGEARAIPVNYRSLILNEALIDWFNPNQNYNDVVIAAANEAGGHGFVTELAGASSALSPIGLTDFEQTAFANLDAQQSAEELLSGASALAGLDGFVDAVRNHVPLPDGVDAETFAQCVQCYLEGSNGAFENLDKQAFLAELEQRVVEPMRASQALFDEHAYVTRLYTTLSADEMTEDPAFDFNSDLDEVSNIHVATRDIECNDLGNPDVEWEAAMPDGATIEGRGSTWPITFEDGQPANRAVLQLGTRGRGTTLTDNGPRIADLIERNNERFGSGCACRLAGAPRPGSGSSTLAIVALVLGVARSRRKSRRHRCEESRRTQSQVP